HDRPKMRKGRSPLRLLLRAKLEEAPRFDREECQRNPGCAPVARPFAGQGGGSKRSLQEQSAPDWFGSPSLCGRFSGLPRVRANGAEVCRRNLLGTRVTAELFGCDPVPGATGLAGMDSSHQRRPGAAPGGSFSWGIWLQRIWLCSEHAVARWTRGTLLRRGA